VVFFAITGILVWLIAIAIGSVVGAIAVIIAKNIGHKRPEEVPEDAVDLEHAHSPAAHSPRPVTARAAS
jgi:PTS system fructose-specific IIC component